jgi:anaerobic magnesium-protoporphyrin IX monomethyl ester cyclase
MSLLPMVHFQNPPVKAKPKSLVRTIIPEQMNNNIILINPSGWQKESINLGLCYLSAALKTTGYFCKIIDLNRGEIEDNEVVNIVRQFSPDMIGISIKTATANEGGRLANMLFEKFRGVVFVAGGPHITICAENYMKEFPVFDYGIMGEGEDSFVKLTKALADGASTDNIPGLVYRKNGNNFLNPWCPPDNLDQLAWPDVDAIEGFDWRGFRYPIVTSRGCPFDCIYCCVNKLTGSRKWRYRSAINVVDELEQVVRNKGIKLFEVWDDNFTLDIKRAKEICHELIRRKLKLSWYCHNGIRADRIDKDLAFLMKQAGCTSVAFGIESGNPETFNAIKKGEPLSAVVDSVKLVKSVGMKAVGYFIIGLPGDTLDKFVDTVRFQRSLNLDQHIFGMLIPYPKTEVWDIVRERGIMFSDITNTQHFSHNIVPISFELPEFPRQDMVRAFYIARFFDLYELVQQYLDRDLAPVVVYMATPNINKYLSGMMIACHPATRHVVVGQNMGFIISHPSFNQVREGTDLKFMPSLPSDFLKDDLIVVADIGNIRKEIFFINSALFVIDPDTHTTALARKKIETRLNSFIAIASLLGVIYALPDVIRRFGIKKLSYNALKLLSYAIFSSYPLLAHRLAFMIISPNSGKRSLPGKITFRLFEMCQFALSLPWHIPRFAITKKKLYSRQATRKSDFPYDDHPAYM